METAISDGRPFRISDLDALGLTRHDLREALRDGRVRRLLRGVYVDARTHDSQELRTAALSLVVGRNQVIVDRTAAWLWGVDTYAAGELAGVPPIEVCVIRGGTRCRHHDVRGRSRDLVDGDVVDVSGLRVTSPLRTALDLGCHLRRREAYAALCELTKRQRLSPTELAFGVQRFQGRRGVCQLRDLVQRIDTRVESPREAWTLITMLDADLPSPALQHWIDIDGTPTYRLDFAYLEHRVAVEYDGEEGHSSDEQREHDERRRAWLRENGWTVIVLRLGDFTGKRLEHWTSEVRRALRASAVERRDEYSSRRW